MNAGSLRGSSGSSNPRRTRLRIPGVQIEDPEAQDTIARVEILGDGEVGKTYRPNTTKLDETFAPEAAPGKHCYYIRVGQTDGQKLWSTPIWITMR